MLALATALLKAGLHWAQYCCLWLLQAASLLLIPASCPQAHAEVLQLQYL
jgi:hypothetical protein